MSITAWIVFVIAAAAAVGFAGFIYRRREAAVRHRRVLTALRAVALILLLLVIFDPALPVGGGGTARSAVALDASLSMNLARSVSDTTTRWTEAVALARRMAGDGPVLLFGDDVRGMQPDSLSGVYPRAPVTRLLPAVRAAAEAGARRLVVITDGGIEDGPEVARWLARYGVTLEVHRVGDGRPATRALAEVEAPAWREAGEPVPVRIAVGGGDEPVTLVVSAPGAPPVRAELAGSTAGRLQVAELDITPDAPREGGLVRLDVALEGASGAVRSVYVYVGEEPAGVALVSLQPDWEPRFLVPVLETALGLPVRGFLRAADGTFVRIGTAAEAGARVPPPDVQRALNEADLIVLHGAGGSAPEWLRAAAANARRIIFFPADAGAPGLPVQLGQPVADDFYIMSDVPSSPIAPLLAGLPVEALPPLTELRAAEALGTAWAPLLASRLRRGAAEPVLLAGETDGRRWAVALGSGYWRWAFRDEAGRTTYARFWGALAGWLLREEGTIAGAAVRPARRSVPQGTAIPWVAPGLLLDSLRVELTAPGRDSGFVRVVRARGDTLQTAAPAPGHYTYDATAFAGDSVATRASGPITVEPYTPELARAAVDLEALQAQATPIGPDADERAPSRPLRASPAPWLLLVALLAAEWILRRRWGLR